MYFMGNSFQTVYHFCKGLHLRSYRAPHTSFSSFSHQFQVLKDFAIEFINLGFFGIRKSTVGEVGLLLPACYIQVVGVRIKKEKRFDLLYFL